MAARNERPMFTGFGKMADTRGFTLIELMIVVAIIAVLTSIAYPTYTRYIVKTKRAAATGCLSEYANYMERYYMTKLSYVQDTGAAFPALDCGAASQTGDSYSYGFAATPTASAYTVQAKPINAQATRDTTCGTLAINQSGQRYYQSTQSDLAGLATCWKN